MFFLTGNLTSHMHLEVVLVVLQGQHVEARPLLRSLCIHREAPWLPHRPVHCLLALVCLCLLGNERHLLSAAVPSKTRYLNMLNSVKMIAQSRHFFCAVTRRSSARDRDPVGTRAEHTGSAEERSGRVGHVCDAEAQEGESWPRDETSTSGHTGASICLKPLVLSCTTTTSLGHEKRPCGPTPVWHFIVFLGTLSEIFEACGQPSALSGAQLREYPLGGWLYGGGSGALHLLCCVCR